MYRPIEIVGDRHLETLGNCGGYYECPKDSQGNRLGPLVGYAGTYECLGGKPLQFVGDVYANFAKAEPHANVLKYFANCLSMRLDAQIGLRDVDVFCGAPIGGYSLTDALGLANNIDMIKMEKKVTALKTATSREQSELVFSRHDVERGARCVIVEDVCNNLSTMGKAIQLIHSRGGIVVAILCFLNRSPTVDDVYHFLVSTSSAEEAIDIPVISLVRKVIDEWKQNDSAVSLDVAKGNVTWKPKDEWNRLMQAMHA